VSPFPIAISTSVFGRTFTPEHIDALDDSTIAAVEIVGPDTQCSFDQPGVRDALRVRFRDARVRLHSVHLPYGSRLDLSQPDTALRTAAVEQTTNTLRAAAALGATLAVVHPSAEPIPTDAESRAAHLDASRHSLELLAPIALDVGVRLAVECLPRTCLGHTAAELLDIVDPVDPRAIGVCIDVNHLNLREPDLASAVATLGPRLLTLHCSDNDGLDERHWLPGHPQGVVDWDAFLTGLTNAGYGGPFLYELRSLDLDVTSTLRAVERNYAEVIVPRYPVPAPA
jgi:sugar phosphate isomerase/epimerase